MGVALVVAGAVLLPGCSAKPSKMLADQDTRRELVEALVTDATARQEVIDRLVGSPTERTAVFERIQKDESVIGALVEKVVSEDRGRAILAAKVAADPQGAKTFIRMLMLTGVMGESMTQQQADALGLGEPYAYGNQRRTMLDLRRVGVEIESWAKKNEGRYPVCDDFGRVDGCLSDTIKSADLAALRIVDAWGNPFLYHSDPEGSQYVLVSYATDGKDDGLGKVGPTASFDCDIVFSNGDFIQWPGWIRKGELR
jgi:hypothetical protein